MGGWGKLSASSCPRPRSASRSSPPTRASHAWDDAATADYIRTARAGLSEMTVLLKHALKNAFLPVLSYLGPATAYAMTGSFVIEKVFDPGLGQHFVNGVLNKDLFLIMASSHLRNDARALQSGGGLYRQWIRGSPEATKASRHVKQTTLILGILIGRCQVLVVVSWIRTRREVRTVALIFNHGTKCVTKRCVTPRMLLARPFRVETSESRLQTRQETPRYPARTGNQMARPSARHGNLPHALRINRQRACNKSTTTTIGHMNHLGPDVPFM